jgi:hypothetical protein
MEVRTPGDSRRFRVWIAHCAEWRPVAWNDLPPVAIACEPAADVVYNATEAAAFVEGFNRAMLAEPRQIWAVAVPVTLRFDGDAQPGLPICGHAFAADDSAADDSATLLTLVSEPVPEDHVQGLGQSPQRSR